MEEFRRLFEQEARRLRLNMLRLPGLVASDTEWQTPLLARMRGLEPGATWQDVFPGVRLPDPDPHLANAIAEVDADPEAWWREEEVAQEFWAELRRLVPFHQLEPRSDEYGFGFSIPEDTEYALRALRSLPDGAGWSAFREALHCKRPTE